MAAETNVERLTGTLEFVLGRRLQPEHVYSVAGRIRSQVIYSTDRERLKSSISPPYCWRSQGNDASALELVHLKGNGRVEKARAYLKDQLKKLKLASIEAV